MNFFFFWGGCLFTSFTFLHTRHDPMISDNFEQTLMKHIQNNRKSIGKSIPAYGFLKSRLETFANLCDFQKKSIGKGIDLKVDGNEK